MNTHAKIIIAILCFLVVLLTALLLGVSFYNGPLPGNSFNNFDMSDDEGLSLDQIDFAVCPQDARLCPDGETYVSRTGPNCEFDPCPWEALPGEDPTNYVLPQGPGLAEEASKKTQ